VLNINGLVGHWYEFILTSVAAQGFVAPTLPKASVHPSC